MGDRCIQVQADNQWLECPSLPTPFPIPCPQIEPQPLSLKTRNLQSCNCKMNPTKCMYSYQPTLDLLKPSLSEVLEPWTMRMHANFPYDTNPKSSSTLAKSPPLCASLIWPVGRSKTYPGCGYELQMGKKHKAKLQCMRALQHIHHTE